MAFRLSLLGATDKEMADFFGVAERTLHRWKKTEPAFCQSLKEGKLSADAEVSDRLNQRARGFEYDEAQPIKLKEVIYDKGKRVKETERIEVVMVHRVVPPDTTACIFWLKNRRPAQWRDRVPEDSNADPTEIARQIRDAMRQADSADGLNEAA